MQSAANTAAQYRKARLANGPRMGAKSEEE